LLDTGTIKKKERKQRLDYKKYKRYKGMLCMAAEREEG